MIAVDTNLLVYAHRREMPFHERARQVLNDAVAAPEPVSVPWPCVHTVNDDLGGDRTTLHVRGVQKHCPRRSASRGAGRREHGRFVMINTNFPFVNNFVPSLNLIQTASGGEPG